MTKCQEKHTKYQVADKDFKCPKCDTPAGDFYIDRSPNSECEKIHPIDEIVCLSCDFRATGQAFANQVKKALGLVKCECCKGAGYVKPDAKKAEASNG